MRSSRQPARKNLDEGVFIQLGEQSKLDGSLLSCLRKKRNDQIGPFP